MTATKAKPVRVFRRDNHSKYVWMSGVRATRLFLAGQLDLIERGADRWEYAFRTVRASV